MSEPGPIGAIDPEQRRVAERLVLAALRRFHREQPLSVDLRMDSLVSRVRSASGRKPPPRHRGATPLTLEDAELRRVIDEQPDDSTFEEIIKELAFAAMVERGLADVEAGRTISHEEMRQTIESWRK